MSAVAGWSRDRLLRSRHPLLCDRCRRLIPKGETLFVEEAPRALYACSEACANALSVRDAVASPPPVLPRPPPERLRDASQSDADDPEF